VRTIYNTSAQASQSADEKKPGFNYAPNTKQFELIRELLNLMNLSCTSEHKKKAAFIAQNHFFTDRMKLSEIVNWYYNAFLNSNLWTRWDNTKDPNL